MSYLDIGYSNIRLPNNEDSYIYKYDYRANTFPEEVFLHEFLHSLERTLINYGYDIPALHDNEKFGFKNEKLIGLKKWYEAYMKQEIVDTNTGKKIGLYKNVYGFKPTHKSDFDYSYEMTEVFKEPQNIIEETLVIFKSFGKVFNTNTPTIEK